MGTTIKFTAVMPTRNQERYLEEALASVVSQVDLLVAVNDASTDGTQAILESWRDQHSDKIEIIVNEKQLGTAQAINVGTDDLLWRCQWCSWVSSDNVHTSDWREKLMAQASPSVGVVYSAFWFARSGTRGSVHCTPYDPKKLIGQEACYFGPSFAIRSDVWRATGGHRGAISHDYDHWLRVEETCWRMGLKIVNVPDPLCRYRVHNERRTVTERRTYDAPHWQAEARKRRQC